MALFSGVGLTGSQNGSHEDGWRWGWWAALRAIPGVAVLQATESQIPQTRLRTCMWEQHDLEIVT